jgi:hypothetical protein
MSRTSFWIERLTKEMEPDAFVPGRDWHLRHEQAICNAKDLLSGNSTDHMVAGMLLLLDGCRPNPTVSPNP